MRLPIVARYWPSVTDAELAAIQTLAGEIRRDHPELAQSESTFHAIRIDQPIDDSPALHLDDYSEIPLIGTTDNAVVLQQRARLRAGDGDYVALSRTMEPGFADYCEYRLGLGRVNWLYPAVEPSQPRQLALECWQDRRLRHDLIHAIRHQGLKYIHPHIATHAVWELAQLLHQATRQPIKVIGPTPAVASLVNDKVEFTRIVERLLGPSWAPRTEVAYNLTTLAQLTSRLIGDNARLGIKFPYGTGGQGNFLIHTDELRGRSLPEIHDFIQQLLDHRWPATERVLVDVWESQVLSSPSVQIWIPQVGNPPTSELPMIEGLFNQVIVGESGTFTGSYPIQYPAKLQELILTSAMRLAILVQELGYVGRCSFDLILVGEDLDSCRVEFIECNGRWGGTSAPMTLINRLFSQSPLPAYRIGQIKHPILSRIPFARLTRELETELFRSDHRQGNLLLFNPARMRAGSAIEVIALGESMSQSEQLIREELPARFNQIAHHLPLAD